MKKSEFGAIEMIHENEDIVYKQVHMPEGNILNNIDLQMDHLDAMEEKVKEYEGRRRLRESWPTCQDPIHEDEPYFYMFPMYIGELHDDHQKTTY